METSDDEQTTSIVAQGGKEDLERFAKTLGLVQRGMVYVKGIFDQADSTDESTEGAMAAISAVSASSSFASATPDEKQ